MVMSFLPPTCFLFSVSQIGTSAENRWFLDKFGNKPYQSLYRTLEVRFKLTYTHDCLVGVASPRMAPPPSTVNRRSLNYLV